LFALNHPCQVLTFSLFLGKGLGPFRMSVVIADLHAVDVARVSCVERGS
jgi:hypothetical protein